MARISTYAIDGLPTVNDKVIGTDAENADVTMNYTIGDIIGLVPGGASSVQSLNTLTGALTLVGAGGNTITVSGTTITITGTSSSGGITSINTTATGPNVNLEGKGGLIVTEVGNTIFLGTSGAASYDAPTNTLNIPVITGGSTLPYTTYVARYSTSGTSASPQELENTTGGTFTWARKTGLSEQIEIVFSGILGSGVLILCNGRGGDKAGGVQAFYNTTDNNSTILIDILDSNFTPSALDIIEGMFELRIYNK